MIRTPQSHPDDFNDSTFMIAPWEKYADHTPDSEIWKYGDGKQYIEDYIEWIQDLPNYLIMKTISVRFNPLPESWSKSDIYKRAVIRDPLYFKTVIECVEYLAENIPQETIYDLIQASDSDLPEFQFGLAQGIRNDFGMWDGNTELLNDCGTTDPDVASGVVLKALQKRLKHS